MSNEEELVPAQVIERAPTTGRFTKTKLSTDLDGNNRIIAGIVDMGAYEALPIINLPLIIS